MTFDHAIQLKPPGGASVAVRSRRILAPATCELRDGGLTIPGCDHHIEVIDIPTGIMYLVPITDRQLQAITARRVAA